MVKEWDNPDVAKISASLDNHFTQDAVWHMDPISRPRNGKEAIKKVFNFPVNMKAKGWIIKSQVAVGDTVFNERIDKMETDGKLTAAPVVGVFKVRDGKICEWRDYADSGTKIKEGSLADLAAKGK